MARRGEGEEDVRLWRLCERMHREERAAAAAKQERVELVEGGCRERWCANNN